MGTVGEASPAGWAAALPVPCYADGRPYRGLHTRHSGRPRPRDCRQDRVGALCAGTLAWGPWWARVQRELRARGFAPGTIRTYRGLLRGFYRFARGQPGQVDRARVQAYLEREADRWCSWGWLAMNISVLRSVFDKLGGGRLLEGVPTPKRPWRLPEILSAGEVGALLAALPSARDQLVVGLLYGCGLQVGELRALRWADVGPQGRTLWVGTGRGPRRRQRPVPEELQAVLALGRARCPPAGWVFAGRQAQRPLSVRRIEQIVRGGARAAGIAKPVTAGTLRHSYAVHSLEEGQSLRAVQEALGHGSVRSTERYLRCSLPPGLRSPLARVRLVQQRLAAAGGGDGAAARPLPLSLCASELAAAAPPFAAPAPGPAARAAAFCRLLKTQLWGRFLALRGSDRVRAQTGRRHAGGP